MIKRPNFELEGLNFRVLRPGWLSNEQWRQIQALERQAFGDALAEQCSQPEIDYLVDWNNPR
jgi:hypothetical protein